MADQSIAPRAEVSVQVHPRSRRAALAFVGDVLHVWVTAPPVEGAANAAVIALLAQTAGVVRSRVTLLRGATARHKRFAIAGITLAELRAAVGAASADE
jgi:uncharacterized protein YggU (UPF0235/DUF167 family)